MANKGRSEPNLFGGYTHYDSKGNKIGRSDPGLFGGYTHYDSNRQKMGSSSPNLFGGSLNYGDWNNTPIRSDKNIIGSQGCYIETCVYGSYDCLEVWTLRCFRDYTLAKHFLGRVFIKVYYAMSPKVVKCFGGTKLFQLFWKKKHYRMDNSLNIKDVEDTPYKNKY